MTDLAPPPPLRVGSWEPADPPEPAALVPVEGPGSLPVPRLEGGQVAAITQAGAAIRHAFRTGRRRAKDLAGREGNVVAGLIAAQPESVQQHQQYLHSRGWIPPGHETGGVVERAGVLYHLLIGTRGVAWHNARSAMYARPYRWAIWFLVRYLLAVTGLFVFGDAQAAIWMCVALPVATALLFVALWLPDLAAKRNDKKEGT